MSKEQREERRKRMETASVMAKLGLHLIEAGYSPAMVIGYKPGVDQGRDYIVVTPDTGIEDILTVLMDAVKQVEKARPKPDKDEGEKK